jgi:hypothetical protein
MGRRPADEAVVLVKPGACDPVVTSVRVNHRASARAAEVKGGTRERFWRFITDRGSEISPEGDVGDWPRRKHWLNQRQAIVERTTQSQE